MLPESNILSRNSGFDEAYYADDQYRSYCKDESILYPAHFLDEVPYNLYHPKTRTFVLEIGNQTYLFPSSEFDEDTAVGFSQDKEGYVVFHDNRTGLLQAFQTPNQFLPIRDANGLHFEDQEGRLYTILGKGIGHDQNLRPIPGFVSYWYAGIVLFPNSNIFRINDFVNYNVSIGQPHVVIPAQKASERFFVFGMLVIFVTLSIFGFKWLRKQLK